MPSETAKTATSERRRQNAGRLGDAHAKEDLARKLNEIIDAQQLSQGEVAQLLGMSQPKVSGIRNYKLRGISLQRLLVALTALGQHVQIVVKPSSLSSPARIDVAA